MQIGRATDPTQLPTAVQFGGHRHRVGGLTAVVEVEDHLGDVLVGRPVEIGGLHLLQDVGDRILGQQHAAQHGLFGGHVLRGLAADVLAGRLLQIGVSTGMTEVVYDSHEAPPPHHQIYRKYVRYPR